MNKAHEQQASVEKSFEAIVQNEYGPDAALRLGHEAVRTVVPFGDQFMEDIPNTLPNPTATGRGGQTVTTKGGAASLDDSSSNDVS